MCKILQHLDDRWIIVSENIQLDKTAADGMIIKMRRYTGSILLICWSLNRRKMMYIHISRNNHNTARMLASSALNACTACSQAGKKRRPLAHALFLEILPYITICGFFSNCCNCTCTKYVVLAKKLLCIFVSHRLIITREI